MKLALAFVVTCTAAWAEEPDGDPAQLARTVASADDALRRSTMAALSKTQRYDVLQRSSTDELIKMSKGAIAALGTYGVKVTKQERVGEKMIDWQTAQMWVQPAPLAIRMYVVAGLGRGRKVIYNEALRKDEMRAQEAGFLSNFGGFWVNINSSLTRKESNHPITDVGFARLVEQVEQDFAKSPTPHVRKDEGADADGLYCVLYTAPKGSKALTTRLCFDPIEALPMRAELSDELGLLEKYKYADLKRQLTVAKDHFTPDGAGI